VFRVEWSLQSGVCRAESAVHHGRFCGCRRDGSRFSRLRQYFIASDLSPEGLDWIFLSRSEQLVYNSAKSHPDGGHWP
jgi:hypothetical protein